MIKLSFRQSKLSYSIMERFWLVSCLFWMFQYSNSDELPSYLKVCYRDDPQLSECLKQEIERLMPILKSGSKEFNLQPLDPLTLTNLTFKYKSSLIGGVATLKKSVVTGLAYTKVIAVRPKVDDPKKCVVDFDMYMDKGAVVNTSYKLDGNVERFPVNMEGNLNLEFGGINLRYHVAADVKTVDGREYLYLESFKGRPIGDIPKTLRLLNDDVVIGRPVLNTLVKTVVKVSWKLLKNAMFPTLVLEADRYLKSIFLHFFKKYPYDVIFPKNKPKI